MKQSDTPRTDAAAERGSNLGLASAVWSGIWPLARDLERELAAATRERDEWEFAARNEAKLAQVVVRERDEARALNAQWAEKAATWMASPEAAQRLQGYRDLAQQVATAQNERDEARAEVERLRKTLDEIATYWNGSHRPAETLDAAEWMRGVAEEALAATEPKP